MLRSTFILGSIGALVAPHYLRGKSQSPAEWWNDASQGQQAFAAIVYKIGVRYGDKEHTAVGITWMESSLGADTTHNEDSFGYCGLSEVALRDLGHGHAVFDSLKLGTLSLETEIFLALDYFFLCKKRLQNDGLFPTEAYISAYPKYSTGKHFRRFRKRGEVFRQRVNFLMRVFR